MKYEFTHLKSKATEYYALHGAELEQIRKLIAIRLNQLALVYTTEHKLPRESVIVTTRVKTLKSYLQKIERKISKDGSVEEDCPKKNIHDLIGARVTCWFLDDCVGMYNFILSSKQFQILPLSEENYITQPKPSGYRSIHLLAKISYDSNVIVENNKPFIIHDDMTCEIQVRTKLMDTWADLTHEFQYKAKAMGIANEKLERILEEQANRFFSEDKSFIAIRDVYQEMTEKLEK